MIEVKTLEQLNDAIKTLKENHRRGLGVIDLIRSLDLDPLTDLRGADWRGTDFSGSDLRGADFSQCRLAYCDFTEADVAGAVFHGADLYRCSLHRALNVSSAFMSVNQRKYLEFCRQLDEEDASEEGQVFHLNQRIRAATTFNGALLQFEKIVSGGLKPDVYSAGLFLARAQNPEQAWEAYQRIERAGCPVNEIVFTTLAAKMKTPADVRDVMGIMRSKGFEPGVRIYNTLLVRSKSDREFAEVLAEMHVAKVPRDNFTYDVLMWRADFAGRKALLEELVRSGLRPRVEELNTLLKGAVSEEEAEEALEIADDLDIGRDVETYALLAPFKARKTAFLALVEDMSADGVSRDLAFYVEAISRTRSFHAACFLYGRMRREAVPPDERIYERLAYLAEVPVEGRDPGRAQWPEEAIAALIRKVGDPRDCMVAGVSPRSDP